MAAAVPGIPSASHHLERGVLAFSRSLRAVRNLLFRNPHGKLLLTPRWPNLGHIPIPELVSLARGRPCAAWLKPGLTEQDTVTRGMRLG